MSTDEQLYLMYAHVENWPSRWKLAGILQDAGFDLYLGAYSIRINNTEHFKFEELKGDLGPPQVRVEYTDLNELIEIATKVSEAFTKNGIRHNFEIYDEADEMVEVIKIPK